MQEPVTAPYGSWRSPITAETIVKGSIRLGQIVVDGTDIYWSELRPTEGGRTTIVRRRADVRTTCTITAPPDTIVFADSVARRSLTRKNCMLRNKHSIMGIRIVLSNSYCRNKCNNSYYM